MDSVRTYLADIERITITVWFVSETKKRHYNCIVSNKNIYKQNSQDGLCLPFSESLLTHFEVNLTIIRNRSSATIS